MRLRSIWKVARWVVLAALAIAIVLMLSRPAPVARPMPRDVADQKAADFQNKVTELAKARQAGQPAEVRLDADEVNAALAQGGAAAIAAAARQQPETATGETPKVQSTQVFFHGDEVTGQFETEVYGKTVVVTVAGKLGSKEGYVSFAPTEFRIGDMPVPVSMVNSALQRKLMDPENREKLKLPEYVADIRIENGQLVVVEQ